MRPRDFKKRFPPAEPKVEETKEEPMVVEEPIAVEGEVFNVNRYLNVREHPKVEVNNIVGIIEKGMRIVVTDKKPVSNKDGEWYKIKVTKTDLEGYVMKKYIKIL